MTYTLYHAKGCGSVAVQVALRVLDVRHHLVELDYDETVARTEKDTPAFRAFTTANPLGLHRVDAFRLRRRGLMRLCHSTVSDVGHSRWDSTNRNRCVSYV